MSIFTQHERMVLSSDPAILDLRQCRHPFHTHGRLSVVVTVEERHIDDEEGIDDRVFVLTMPEVEALRDKLSELLEGEGYHLTPEENTHIENKTGVVGHESGTVITKEGERWALCWVRMPKEGGAA